MSVILILYKCLTLVFVIHGAINVTIVKRFDFVTMVHKIILESTGSHEAKGVCRQMHP